MAAYVGAWVMKNALVKFGGTDYDNQVHKARLVPEVNEQTYRTLDPDGTIVDVDEPVWTLELEGIQDWETNGLADYMRDNAGALVTAIIAPVVGTGKQQATVSVRARHLPFGGTQGEFGTFDITLGVSGQPTFAAQS
jgi:hypothetical protein